MQAPTVKVPKVDVLEADLIVLMNALCRLAARRQSGTDADLYVKAGKKLASDILMKVLCPDPCCSELFLLKMPASLYR